MKIIQRKIKDIKPYERNAKKHDGKQITKIAESIETFGFNQPIVVDKNDVVIVGHGRLFAAQKLGLKEIPVLKIDISEEKAKAYRLADNKLNESEWDMGLVIDELKELSMEMLDLTGFDRELILEDDAKDDDIPDLPKKPISKLGDVYELGEHRIQCGDSCSEEAVEKLLNSTKCPSCGYLN